MTHVTQSNKGEDGNLTLSMVTEGLRVQRPETDLMWAPVTE